MAYMIIFFVRKYTKYRNTVFKQWLSVKPLQKQIRSEDKIDFTGNVGSYSPDLPNLRNSDQFISEPLVILLST